MSFRYRDFYEAVRDILDTINLYEIYTEYQPKHLEILELIEEIDKAQGKYHDNFRHKFLPKNLTFSEAVTHAVVTTNKRFINENSKYEEALKELPKGSFIGYYTTVKKAIFYTEDRRSLGQFVVPKKGLLIPQKKEIEIIEKESIRQRRSDSKYHDLKLIDEIKIKGEPLKKKVFRKKEPDNIA